MGAHHDTLREVRLGENNGAERLQHLDERGIVTGRRADTTDVAQGCVESADIKLVFERHGDAMQRSDSLTVIGAMPVKLTGVLQCTIKAHFGQAVDGQLLKVRVRE